MSTTVQILFNSLSSIALYTQLALGLSVFLGVFGIMNFAQGDFATVGSYAIFSVMAAAGIGVYVAAAIGLIAGGILGLLFYFVIVKTLRNAPQVNQILATFGVGLVLQGLIQWRYTATPKSIPVSKDKLTVGGATVQTTTLVNIAVALVLMALLFAFLYRTGTGRQIRAVSQNRVGASLIGIDAGRVSMIACVVAGVLSAGAALVILDTSFLTPTVGFESIFKAFTVVVAAGLGNLRGVLVAAVALGVVESFVQYAISDAAGQLVGFALIVGILLIRPTGLLRAQTV
ncbi:branched-chain amino acid ABC transporter permease [Cryptosporangium sp. NPDC048952]|uniref:branched-chain amino acid ABC transporter permease n=1 Tax=Cryptosporangium sp. NPDC048952 TaxID=3363961 RepID=UPI0037101316